MLTLVPNLFNKTILIETLVYCVGDIRVFLIEEVLRGTKKLSVGEGIASSSHLESNMRQGKMLFLI